MIEFNFYNVLFSLLTALPFFIVVYLIYKAIPLSVRDKLTKTHKQWMAFAVYVVIILTIFMNISKNTPRYVLHGDSAGAKYQPETTKVESGTKLIDSPKHERFESKLKDKPIEVIE